MPFLESLGRGGVNPRTPLRNSQLTTKGQCQALLYEIKTVEVLKVSICFGAVLISP